MAGSYQLSRGILVLSFFSLLSIHSMNIQTQQLYLLITAKDSDESHSSSEDDKRSVCSTVSQAERDLETKSMRALISAGANINYQDKYGNGFLHHAINHGKPHLVHILLDYKANPNLANHSGRTPLFNAVSMGDIYSLSDLLSYKSVDIDPHDMFDYTPLFLAFSTTYESFEQKNTIIFQLLRVGASMLTCVKDKSPLHLATHCADTQELTQLIKDKKTPEAVADMISQNYTKQIGTYCLKDIREFITPSQ